MKKRNILLLTIFLLVTTPLNLKAKNVIENAEDGYTDKWRVIDGNDGDIINIYDKELNSRVIELNGGGSYRIGATGGTKALNIKKYKTISWKMKTTVPYTIYVITETKEGLRYIFYVSTASRGLKHGLLNGVHHGLGETTISGRWRRVTRDLERDLKDAEPNNEIIAINGFIYNGGDGGRLDDIILYNPQETIYNRGEIRVNDNYQLDINNNNSKILQWSFKGFGEEPKILDERWVNQDIEAFEFRVNVESNRGNRDLVYTLGERDLGIIENGKSIHHALGDDRILGSVWAGDNPLNKLGLWQGVTRDLEEDLKDFEDNISLISVNSFKITKNGLVNNIKMLSETEGNSKIIKKSSNSVGDKLFLISTLIYISLISIFLLFNRKIFKKLNS